MSTEHQHLAESERHIAQFRQNIVEQEKRITDLAADGHPADEALALLKSFKETLPGRGTPRPDPAELRGGFRFAWPRTKLSQVTARSAPQAFA
jgi:hypothetical protein